MLIPEFMTAGNLTEALEKIVSLYQQLRESNKDVYSVDYSHVAWISHEDIFVHDTYLFVLPDRERALENGSVRLTDDDYSLLEGYNLKLVNSIPIDKIKSKELGVTPFKETDFKTLDTLFKEGVVFSRRRLPC